MDIDWTDALAVAARQHSVLHRDQARATGIPDDRFRRAARAGLTTSLQRSVVLAPGAQRTFESDVAAAALEVGGRVAVTGESALYLHRLIAEPPSAVQLVVPSDRRRPSVRGVDDIVRSRTLRASDIVVVGGVPVVRLPWALLHLGRRSPERRVVALAIRAAQRERLEPSDVDAVLERCGRAPGRARLRAAYEQLVGEAVDSSFELDVRRFLRRAGIVAHPSPFPFRCADGHVVHLDVPFPDAWFAVECDTVGSHGDPDHLDRDRRRWSRAQADGWRITWVTPARLRADGPGFLAEVEDALSARTGASPPPEPSRCRRKSCRACRKTFEG